MYICRVNHTSCSCLVLPGLSVSGAVWLVLTHLEHAGMSLNLNQYFHPCLQGTLRHATIEKGKLIIKCLIIICRCPDNIPLVASMDFVPQV